MSLGKKTGGRQKGTPNKRTLEPWQVLAELDCDPIEGMARIAKDETTSPELRGRMLAELAQYAYPKRKAVEVTNVWDGDFSKLTDAQLGKVLEYVDAASKGKVILRPDELELLRRLEAPAATVTEPAIDVPAESQDEN